MRVFLYVACVLDGECRASLTELQALGEELGSAAQVTMRWTGKLLSRAADLWPLLPNIPKPLAELLSFGVGFIPVVGDLYDLLSGITGYDLITGERLPEWAQALALAAAFLPLISASELRYADDTLSYADEALDFEQDVGRFIGRACSFSADTTVHTADGPEAIADVEAGDQVLAWDGWRESSGWISTESLPEATTVPPLETALALDLTADGIPAFLEFLIVPAGEWVTLANGETRQAWMLHVGDRVVMTSGKTGIVRSVETRPATPATFTPAKNGNGYRLVLAKSKRLVETTLNLHVTSEIIKTTPEHLFYVDGEWVAAQELSAGDRIRTQDGSAVTVERIEQVRAPRFVYSLQVEGAHTFYVGESGLLAHNCAGVVKKAIDAGLPHRLYGNDKTSGFLFDSAGNQLRDIVISGRKNNPWAFDSTLVRDGYNRAYFFQDHAEAQAAGFMRDSNLTEVTLVLNNYPCPACDDYLELMVPEEATLHVIVPDGFDLEGRGVFYWPYTGKPSRRKP